MKFLTDGREVMCPHVNQADPRCGRHLTLDDLAWAFSHCVERPASCPIYWEIAADDRIERQGRVASVSASG